MEVCHQVYRDGFSSDFATLLNFSPILTSFSSFLHVPTTVILSYSISLRATALEFIVEAATSEPELRLNISFIK